MLTRGWIVQYWFEYSTWQNYTCCMTSKQWNTINRIRKQQWLARLYTFPCSKLSFNSYKYGRYFCCCINMSCCKMYQYWSVFPILQEIHWSTVQSELFQKFRCILRICGGPPKIKKNTKPIDKQSNLTCWRSCHPSSLVSLSRLFITLTEAWSCRYIKLFTINNTYLEYCIIRIQTLCNITVIQ